MDRIVGREPFENLVHLHRRTLGLPGRIGRVAPDAAEVAARRAHEDAGDPSELPLALDALKDFADLWLFRSRSIKKWIVEKNIVNFTYEDFCANPKECVSRLYGKISALRSADITKSITVKGYKRQALENMNPRQIGKLNQQELGAISDVLNTDTELVAFFGYDSKMIK